MTLQDIVNQTQYAARKATLGIVLGFSLASAPGLVYAGAESLITGIGVTAANGAATLVKPFDSTMIVKPLPPPLPPLPLPPYADKTNPLPIGSSEDNNGVRTGIVKEQHIKKYYSTAGQESFTRFDDSQRVAAKLEERLQSIEQSGFPSLTKLKQDCHDFEQRNGSTHYKVNNLDAYYVHYPQQHRIYYVERKDKTTGEGRTTVALFITNENGKLLFRANEQGEMVRVQSGENTESKSEKKKDYTPKQPDSDDKPEFVNFFGCLARNELYSATGIGPSAVIGSIGATLYIRHRRRRKSRSK